MSLERDSLLVLLAYLERLEILLKQQFVIFVLLVPFPLLMEILNVPIALKGLTPLVWEHLPAFPVQLVLILTKLVKRLVRLALLVHIAM